MAGLEDLYREIILDHYRCARLLINPLRERAHPSHVLGPPSDALPDQ